MFSILRRCISGVSPVQKQQNLCWFPLFLCLALILSGCHTHSGAPTATKTIVAPARSVVGLPSATVQMQSTPLFQQARRECKRGDYLHAAQLLDTLAKTPGLAPDAVVFVQNQKAICLKDAGQPVVATTVAPLPAPTPPDADCGPRALLLVCRQLGVKANLEALRKTAATTSDGTTMEGLQKAAQKFGLKAEGVQVSREALPDVSTPAIAWDRRRHFIVVLSLSGRGDGGTATIHDPNQPGQETISQENLLQRSSGILLLVHR